MTLDRPDASPMRQVVRAPADCRFAAPRRDVPRPARGARHGRTDARGRSARRRRPARKRPPHDHRSRSPTTRPTCYWSTARRAGSSATFATPWPATRTSRSKAVVFHQPDPGRIVRAPRTTAMLPRATSPARTNPTRSAPSRRSSSATSTRPTCRPRDWSRLECVRRRARRDADHRPRPEVLVGPGRTARRSAS